MHASKRSASYAGGALGVHTMSRESAEDQRLRVEVCRLVENLRGVPRFLRCLPRARVSRKLLSCAKRVEKEFMEKPSLDRKRLVALRQQLEQLLDEVMEVCYRVSLSLRTCVSGAEEAMSYIYGDSEGTKKRVNRKEWSDEVRRTGESG